MHAFRLKKLNMQLDIIVTFNWAEQQDSSQILFFMTEVDLRKKTDCRRREFTLDQGLYLFILIIYLLIDLNYILWLF